MLRNHAIAFTENDPVTQIPNSIHYHRKCYQRFTLKRDLANFNAGAPGDPNGKLEHHLCYQNNIYFAKRERRRKKKKQKVLNYMIGLRSP